MESLDPRVIAAIIAGSIGIVLFVLKDIILSLYREFKSDKKSKKKAFQIYAHPLLNSIESLIRRLDEIIELRGDYLLSDSPKNNFNNYKLISTNYRLFCFLGWMRALKMEFNHTNFNQMKKYKSVDNAIFQIESALADGQSLEIQVAKRLSGLLEYDASRLNAKQIRKLGIEIEKVLYKAIHPKNKQLADELEKEDKEKLLLALSETIAKSCNSPQKDKDDVFTKLDEGIKEIALVESLIYRDWQSGIGDFMLVEIQASDRRFDIMGFKEFEEVFSKKSDIWIKRGSKLFESLDFSEDPTYDARINQVKRLFCSLVNFKKVVRDTKLVNGILNKEELEKQLIACERLNYS